MFTSPLSAFIIVTTLVLFIFWCYQMSCYKNRNREIGFNIRELARERELFRQAREHQTQMRTAMEAHHRMYDEIYGDPNFSEVLERIMSDAYKQPQPTHNWQQEGF